MRSLTILAVACIALSTPGQAEHVGALGLGDAAVSFNAVYLPFASQGPTMFPEVIGRIGGESARRVVMEGNLAYVGVESPPPVIAPSNGSAEAQGYIRIIDISDPTQPLLVGRTPPYDGEIEAIAVDRGHAYLLMRGARWYNLGSLKVFDVANPAAPRLVSEVSDTGRALAVGGGYAYIDGYRGDKLHVIDVRDPARPKDILRPTGPTDSDPTSLVLSGSLLLRAQSEIPSLSVFDVSTPDAPSLVAIEDLSPEGQQDVFVRLAADGNRAYVVVNGMRPLFVNVVKAYDLSRPSRPRLVGEMEVPGALSAVGAGGHRLYMSRADKLSGSHIAVVDTEPPSRMRVIGVMDGAGYASDIAVSASGAHILATYPEYGLRVWSRRPVTPDEVGMHPILGRVRGASVRSTIAYLDTPTGPSIVDISDLQEPQLLSNVQSADGCAWHSVEEVRAHINCVRRSPDGDVRTQELRAVDVTDPRAPRIIGSMELAPTAYYLRIEDDLVWQLTEGSGLVATDFRDPDHPRPLSSLALPARAKELALAGHAAYVTAQIEDSYYDRCDLISIDVSDPTAPQIVGRESLPPICPIRLTYEAGVLYSSTRDYPSTMQYLLMYDVSDPSSPERLARVPVQGGNYGMKVAQQTLYFSGHSLDPFGMVHGELSIFDVSDPASARQVGSMRVESGTGIADVDQRLYLLWHDARSLVVVDPDG